MVESTSLDEHRALFPPDYRDAKSPESRKERDRVELAWLRYKAGKATYADDQYLAYSPYSPFTPSCHVR